MIYLVSNEKSLFESKEYSIISFNNALEVLSNSEEIQLDTETSGLDCFTKKLLTLQLGTRDNQVVFDWSSLTEFNKLQLKEFLENPNRCIIGHNLMFDLQFLYYHNIWPKKLYDTMVAEQLIYLGFPQVIKKRLYDELELHLNQYKLIIPETNKPPYYELSYSLQATAARRLGIDIDKSVRGQIIDKGLTPKVIIYAATDVMYLQDIKDSQYKDLEEQNMIKASILENEAVKGVAYVKFCGMHLDSTKWESKMQRDQELLDEATNKLNNWVIDYFKSKGLDSKGEIIQDIPYEGQWIHPGDKDWNYPDPIIAEKGLSKDARFIKSYIKEEEPYGALYIKRYKTKCPFLKIDYQGDLFSGFNTDPICTINWSSPLQVIKLFDYLGIDTETFDPETKTKKKSVKENVIAPFKDQFPIIPIYLDYKGADKLVSGYGKNWLKAINPITKRIHVDLHSIGTDTSRTTSGGGVYKLNQQQLPHDKITRGCFTSEEGNLWFSCDFKGQESAITASVSNDPVMINILLNGGDLHSEVARACWPDILGNYSDDEIKEQFKSYRDNAKGVEFSVYYGGDDNTLVSTKGFIKEEASKIYNSFMNKFKGLATYQDYCKREVMKKGYILMNPYYGHRAHIYDAEWLFKMQSKMAEPKFWEEYRYLKRFDPTNKLVGDVSRYFKRKADSGKQSINYRIQNRGACCFKLSLIKLFNWIIDNNYQNIVKICVVAHDELNIEAPEYMKDKISNIILQAMIAGGKPFCTRVPLGADLSVGDHWIH